MSESEKLKAKVVVKTGSISFNTLL